MTPYRQRRRNGRRGVALYITVLSAALIVSLLGLSGLTLMRIELRQTASVSDRLTARANALSAVELALLTINQDSSWRTTYSNGVESVPLAMGSAEQGIVSFILEDTDGSLTDSDTNLRLLGIGRAGDSVQVSSVELKPVEQPLNCLEVANCVGGPIEFESNASISSNQTIHSNMSITAGGGNSINANVEAVGSITGSGFNGAVVTPVAARELPTATVFDYYLTNGTVIPFSAIPKIGPTKMITDMVLSPTNNPYGGLNPEGIYVIDCGGSILRIEYARIIGTLLLVNPSPQSDVQSEISWEPAVPNYPALLMQGVVEFRMTNGILSEASVGVNFNPPGTPYEGVSDNDTADTYPSRIKGIVYLSGDTYIDENHLVVQGNFMSGGLLNVNASDSLTVDYDSSYFSNPPPGSTTIANAVQAKLKSWAWDAAP